MSKIEVKEIVFDDIFDIVHIFRSRKLVSKYVMKLIENNKKKKKELGFAPMQYNVKYGFYNVDYKFLLDTTKELLKDNNVSELEIAKFSGLFDENNKDKFLNNMVLFLQILAVFGITMLPKNRQFYSRVLYKNLKTDKYFMLDSSGINLNGIDAMVTSNYRIDELDSIAVDKDIEMLGYGMKQVASYKKNFPTNMYMLVILKYNTLILYLNIY